MVFGFVLAQLQGFTNLRLRQSLAKNKKSSLRIGYSILLTALGVPNAKLFFPSPHLVGSISRLLSWSGEKRGGSRDERADGAIPGVVVAAVRFAGGHSRGFRLGM